MPPFKLIDIEDMRNDKYIINKFKLNDPFNVQHDKNVKK